jgi:hypothetical protein
MPGPGIMEKIALIIDITSFGHGVLSFTIKRGAPETKIARKIKAGNFLLAVISPKD